MYSRVIKAVQIGLYFMNRDWVSVIGSADGGAEGAPAPPFEGQSSRRKKFCPLGQCEVDNLSAPRFCIGRIGGMLYLGLRTYEPTCVLNRDRKNFYPPGGLPKWGMICYSKSIDSHRRFHLIPKLIRGASWGRRRCAFFIIAESGGRRGSFG